MTTTFKVITAFGVVFVAISIAMAALAVSYGRSAARARGGAEATATVVQSQHGPMVLQAGFVRVRFEADDGEPVEAVINTSINPHLQPGDEVVVRYDTDDPTTARLAGDDAGRNENASGKLVIGAVVSLLLGVLLLATPRSERLQQILQVPASSARSAPPA